MRRLPLIRLLLTATLLCASVPISAQSWLYPDGPQETHHLMVWIVVPQTSGRPRPSARTTAQIDPLGYKESTAGDFGHTAGNAGQTAGSNSTTMGNFGQTAGSVGTPAGNTGTTAGSFQGNVASKNAGDTGKTMGEFGTSTTDLPAAAAAANRISGASTARHDIRWDAFLAAAITAVPKADIRFIDVFSDELESKLSETAGTPQAPDVLLGSPLPAAWTQPTRGLVLRYGVLTLWSPVAVPQQEDVRQITNSWRWPDAAVLAASRNPQSARAFALWVEGGGGSLVDLPPVDPDDAAARIALRATQSMLQGNGPGVDADPDFAEQNTHAVALAALARYGPGHTEDYKLRLDVTDETKAGPLAIVTVRAIGTGPKTFGVAHAAVVLRRDASGNWRVLQVSPLMTRDAQIAAIHAFEAASQGPDLDPAAPLQTISQASPIDGDTRTPEPQLWWDNPGGATLQVVEWQHQTTGWSTSNLFFVPDQNSRVRTQVQARFASAQGQYRWRIWSVAKDGTLVLSAWRTLNIVGR